jgi:sulfatase maturation enzyme AslB (radical SAM superfamily)
MIFSIDGLEDTNHIYRRNVKWDKLISNVKSFINAGGVAEWDYLVFKHNEHQLEEAEKFSKELGFKFFTPKKALGVDNGTNLTKLPALTKDGVLDYYIEAPTDPKNRNLSNPVGDTEEKHYPFDPKKIKDIEEQAVVFFKTRVDNVYSSIGPNRLDTAEINCKSKKWFGGKEVFVDCFGRVFPCCFVGTYLNSRYKSQESLQLFYEIDKYGWDNFDLNNHSLEDILNQRHLDNLYADTWTKPSIREGKLEYCANMCGTASKLDRIYTHEKMTDKTRLERNLQHVHNKN